MVKTAQVTSNLVSKMGSLINEANSRSKIIDLHHMSARKPNKASLVPGRRGMR
jgi:hypothetical protein